MRKPDLKVRKVVIGKVLAALRNNADLNQAEFAAAIGVSQPTLSRFERGASVPDMLQMAAIEDVLDLEPGEFNQYVEEALRRTESAAHGAAGVPEAEPVWATALALAGIAGIAGLAAFAVAALLNEEKDDDLE